MPVIFYQARQYHIPEDSILHTWDNDNLIPHRQRCAFTKTAENMYTITQLCYINIYFSTYTSFATFNALSGSQVPI